MVVYVIFCVLVGMSICFLGSILTMYGFDSFFDIDDCFYKDPAAFFIGVIGFLVILLGVDFIIHPFLS